MKVFVIGGTKFLGPRVVRRLAAEGHEVTVFNRGESGGDLSEGELRRLSPDIVLDMIPMNQGYAQGVM